MVPESGLRKPISKRKATDLPTPLRPSMQRVWVRPTEKLMSSRTARPLKEMLTLLKAITISEVIEAPNEDRTASPPRDPPSASSNSKLEGEWNIAVETAYAISPWLCTSK